MGEEQMGETQTDDSPPATVGRGGRRNQKRAQGRIGWCVPPTPQGGRLCWLAVSSGR